MDAIQDSDKLDIEDLLVRFLKSLRRLFPLVILLTVLFAALNGYRASRSFSPRYRTQATFSVTAGYRPDSLQGYNPSLYDNAAAGQLAKSFTGMLSTDIMRELIMQETGKAYVAGSISAHTYENTNLLILTVTAATPEDAYETLNAVMVCYPKMAGYMTENPAILIREAPTMPTAPYNSFSWKDPVVKGALVGLLIGLAIVAISAFFTRTVHSVDELKTIVNLPVLATFPQVTEKRRRSTAGGVAAVMKSFGFAESTRQLRIKLRKTLDRHSSHVIMITSTLPGEGKTTMSVNLALSLAADGRSVVLVDGDLHKQSVAEVLGLPDDPNAKGLVNLVDDPKLSLDACLREVPDSKLKVLSGYATGGRLHSTDRKALAALFQQLKEKFRYVILDTPPCGIVSDAGTLCRYADTVLYVVKQDYAQRSQIRDGVTAISDNNATLAGCIVNGLEGYSRRYGYGYGYKYGYGYGKKRYGYGYGYGHNHGYGYGTDAEDSTSPDRIHNEADRKAEEAENDTNNPN